MYAFVLLVATTVYEQKSYVHYKYTTSSSTTVKKVTIS